MGVLARHYTLNIDGLAEVVGMDTWHHEHNPSGVTVEMHGNIRCGARRAIARCAIAVEVMRVRCLSSVCDCGVRLQNASAVHESCVRWRARRVRLAGRRRRAPGRALA